MLRTRNVANSTKCNCILLYAYRTRMLFFPITYVQYVYVIPEGNVRSRPILVPSDFDV